MSPSKIILADFCGDVCSACGGAKIEKQSFCNRCYHLLPMKMRGALYKRFGSGYEEAFAAAQKFLENPKLTSATDE